MRTITIPWDIQTYGRVTADDVEDPLFRDGQPWVPAPTFRVPPTALAILSFTAALVLLLSAVSIAARSRGKATPQGIIADDPRWRAMPPIERALRRVRSASYGADLNERRNALDNLAETMKQDAPASDERDAFIREAKELAWPSHDPESEAMQDLATRVKARIGEGR